MTELEKFRIRMLIRMEYERALTLKALANQPEKLKAVEALYERLRPIMYAGL